MLKFQAVGDGNCLYNAEAVALMTAFLQKKLNPLFKNKQRLAEFHRLLKMFQTNGLIEVDNKITQKAVTDGFNALVARFTEEGEINWDTLQREMAGTFREYVQHTMINDNALRPQIRAVLTASLNQCIELAYVNNHEVQGGLPEEIDLSATNGSHFDGMTVIEEKIHEILQDDELETADAKKAALNAWFFDGEAEGYSEYLQGETGIGNDTVHASDVEIRVLSAKLGIVHRTYMQGTVGQEFDETLRYYDGFKSQQDSKNSAKKALVFSFEKTPNHYNCILEDTPANKALIEKYDLSLQSLELEKILAEHKTYEAHCKSLNVTEDEYRRLYSLTAKQFKNNTNKFKKASAKDDEDEVEVIANTPKKKGPVTRSRAQQEAKSAVTPQQNQAVSSPSTLGDLKMGFFGTTAIIATLSFAILLPIIKTALFGGAVVSPGVALIAFAATLAFSCTAGYLLTSKLPAMQETLEAVLDIKAPSKSAKAAPTPKAVDLLDPSPTLLVYQNTRAQQRKREMQVKQDNIPVPPRQKMH